MSTDAITDAIKEANSVVYQCTDLRILSSATTFNEDDLEEATQLQCELMDALSTLNRYLKLRTPLEAEIIVTVSKAELNAINLALQMFDDGHVETEYDTSGLRRFAVASYMAFQQGERT